MVRTESGLMLEFFPITTSPFAVNKHADKHPGIFSI
jgi:hypothetical protein